MSLRFALLFGALLACPFSVHAQAAELEEEPPPPPDSADGPTPEIPEADVRALPGPRADAIPVPPSGYTLRPTTTRARLHVVQLGRRPLTLHATRLDGAPIAPCTAPCTLELERGRYVFSVQPPGGRPRQAGAQPMWLDGPRDVIAIHYDDRSGLRSLGWGFFSVSGTVIGLTLFFDTLLRSLWITLVIGLPIAIAFFIPFLPLAFLGDAALVQISPLQD